MRVLWAPWRLAYVEKPDQGCIFCELPKADDAESRRRNLVLRVSERACTMMNRFPYANGHIMVSPRAHTCEFSALAPDVASALHDELQRTVAILDQVFSPQGFNIGMNLGRCAGAGFPGHLHWHIVPRWEGDTNFMPLMAETRVIPQHLEDAYDRLLPHFQELTP